MRIRRWTLEVLVNEIPLREYVISDSVLGASASNVLKSYVFEGNRKKFCDSATFIAVPGPGTYYSIVVSPSISKIAPKIYVDGRNDDSYVKSSDSSFSIVKGFHNRNRTIRYDFIFDKTEWIETDIPQRTKYGGLGIISVYFYKVKERYESSRNYSIECYGDRSSYKIVRDDEPLAVLHINYRLADWLIPIVANIYTQNSCASSSTSTSSTSSPSTSTTSTSSALASTSSSAATNVDIKNVKKRKRRYQEMIVSSAATNVDIKNEVNNFESDTENKPLITQSIKKRKRRYQEIIVILDSDEECTHEAVELD
ncbi:hypothetical protein RirG_256500 [Rhizophagus irregularis DAOM 197198w]|uniref:Uncharacterized protein n=1 Tax=Rhizophagus irregularis (strain DAOM 197198w) TaxID=1432141 RepID=A0A015I4S4_RHIIW|nr:hypothetical protein RirG_256500 [Rhizophagus irregularis DAOM 197198w]